MLNNILLAAGQLNKLWYMAPLIVSVSLVYAATRHEDMRLIARHSLRVGAWIIGLMLVILAVLLLISMQT
jgi:hypothetical protein